MQPVKPASYSLQQKPGQFHCFREAYSVCSQPSITSNESLTEYHIQYCPWRWKWAVAATVSLQHLPVSPVMHTKFCILHINLIVGDPVNQTERHAWPKITFCGLFSGAACFIVLKFTSECKHFQPVSSHLSLNHEGHWGTIDDFATNFLHSSLFSNALWDLANSRPVHSLMLSSHLFLCLPCLLPPFTVPCKMVLARLDKRETCLNHCWILQTHKLI